MFTGIIEEVGRIAAMEPLEDAYRFRIEAATVLEGMNLGDSVAVNGVCLTATEIGDSSFAVVSVASTLSRTTLGELQVGRKVNLERALSFGARLGGHLVQGHVDGVGEVVAVQDLGESTLIDFTLPGELEAVTILHGSITLDGISLTINTLQRQGIAQVSIVPFTASHTNIGELKPGSRVNLEGDLLGKYVRHLMSRGGGPTPPDLSPQWVY